MKIGTRTRRKRSKMRRREKAGAKEGGEAEAGLLLNEWLPEWKFWNLGENLYVQMRKRGRERRREGRGGREGGEEYMRVGKMGRRSLDMARTRSKRRAKCRGKWRVRWRTQGESE